MLCRAVQCWGILCNVDWCCAVQCSAALTSTLCSNDVQYSTALCCAMLISAVLTNAWPLSSRRPTVDQFLWSAELASAVQWCAMLCSVDIPVLCCEVLCSVDCCCADQCSVQHCAVQYGTVLCCAMLISAVWHYAVQQSDYCAVLCCILLCTADQCMTVI